MSENMSENIVYIGNKPIMNYVLAVLGAFNRVDVDNVVLKARGQAISRAVDVAEVSRRRFLTELQSVEIEIGTEQVPMTEGGTRGVSIISISMKRPRQREAKKTSPNKHTDLSEIKGVGAARAEKLKKAGFKTIESLAKADAGTVSEKAGLSERISANIIEAARDFLKSVES